MRACDRFVEKSAEKNKIEREQQVSNVEQNALRWNFYSV